MRADVECGDGVLEKLGRDSGINQRGEKHVAADSGKAIEVCDAHGGNRRRSLVVGRRPKPASASDLNEPSTVKEPPSILKGFADSGVCRQCRGQHDLANDRRPTANDGFLQSVRITIFFNNIEGLLYRQLERRLAQHMREFLCRSYGLELEKVVIEQPPNVQFGEYAMPLAFELAKKLRKAPRKIAEEIVGGIGPIEGFEKLEVAGAGYINARVDRAALAAAIVKDESLRMETPAGKILVEHSSINPNKAAHIGHLRNAILGDTYVRLLQSAGREVDVQNYIDNTGVQVADVVVGFLHIEKKSRDEIGELGKQPRLDYYCWDLYARVSQWYQADAENKKIRLKTLHEIEQSGTEAGGVGEVIWTAVLGRHLETMDRLDIEYDFLPRESEILRLHFWDAAFGKLKEAGVLSFESEGKNKGCWVMRRAGTAKASTTESTEITEEDQKVIVRSNGTVGHVGKDIAYHMWKFGLLGKDFGYRKFYLYPNGHQGWISAEQGET